jgi:hypothetical protein
MNFAGMTLQPLLDVARSPAFRFPCKLQNQLVRNIRAKNMVQKLLPEPVFSLPAH